MFRKASVVVAAVAALVLIACLASGAVPAVASAGEYGRYSGSFSYDREIDQTKMREHGSSDGTRYRTNYHLIRREHWTVTIGERIPQPGVGDGSIATYHATIAGSVHIEYTEHTESSDGYGWGESANGHWEGSGPIRLTINEIGAPDANGVKTSDLWIEYDGSMTEGLPGQWVRNAGGEVYTYTDPFNPGFDATIAPNEPTARTTNNSSNNSNGSFRVVENDWPATDVLANTQGLTYHPPDAAECRLTATNPQRPSAALRARVVAGAEACKAKVKSVMFKVGRKVYTYVSRLRGKTVAAGKAWKLEFPIKGGFARTVRRALAAGKTVLGRVTADLNGSSRDVTVRIK